MSTAAQYYSQGYYKGLAPEKRFIECAQILKQVKGERFLDIGCGDGSITVFLREAVGAKETFGVEIADEAVEESRKKGIKTYKVDIDREPLPFSENYFDVIYCGEVIEHLFDTDKLLEEIHRVLKPKGHCVISTPNLAGWPNRVALLFGYQPFPTSVSPRHEYLGKMIVHTPQGQWGHLRVMTLRAFKELVTTHRFAIKKVLGCSVTVQSQKRSTLIKLLGAADSAMARFPSMATRVILVIQK